MIEDLVDDDGVFEEGDDAATAEAMRAEEDVLRARHGFGSVLAGESIRLLGEWVLGRDGFRTRTPSLTL